MGVCPTKAIDKSCFTAVGGTELCSRDAETPRSFESLASERWINSLCAVFYPARVRTRAAKDIPTAEYATMDGTFGKNSCTQGHSSHHSQSRLTNSFLVHAARKLIQTAMTCDSLDNKIVLPGILVGVGCGGGGRSD